MMKKSEAEPWRELPGDLAELIEPELRRTTEEILATIAREVPEYARPLEGSFGRGIRRGVTEALNQFVALIRNPDADWAQGQEVYRDLGRGELRQGRTLDSLQAAYRVGARVAWRRLAAVAVRAGTEPATLSLLAESIFAYIDQLASDSVEGYAQAMSAREDERQRRRHALVVMLLREPPAEDAGILAAASAAGWKPPRIVAALACEDHDLDRLRRRLGPEALATAINGSGCVLFPDPAGPGRQRELARAAEGTMAVLGPAGGREGLPASWGLARDAFRLRASGRIGGDGLIRAEDHLAEVVLDHGRAAIAQIARRRLEPLDSLTAKARARMLETALAYVQNGGNAAAIARQLYMHPQSVRHRLVRLRELLGDQLDDPGARFELEAALLEVVADRQTS